MKKRVILITGTPGVGKTIITNKLAEELNAEKISLGKLARKEKLATQKDPKRDTYIVDEPKMRRKIKTLIESSQFEDIIVDGHYGPSVVPERLVSKVFVIRRNPTELRKLMEKRHFSASKSEENLASEILDVCLFEALGAVEKEKICEIDSTGKPMDEVVSEIISILDGSQRCHVGIVDWLGQLESQGILDEYLKI